MAIFEIHYEGIDKPLVVDDIDYATAIGFRVTNEWGSPVDHWHGLVGATKARLVLAKGESLSVPGMTE